MKTFRKAFAGLTALCCVGSMISAFPAVAEDRTTTFIVTAVANPEAPESYVLTNTRGSTYYANASNVAEYADQEYYAVGDILEVHNLSCTATELAGTNSMGIEESPLSEGGCIVKVGSILENPEIQEFTIGDVYEWSCSLDGYHFGTDWVRPYYYQPDMFDYSLLQTGEVVSCYTYEGRPYIISDMAEDNVFNVFHDYLVIGNDDENYILMEEHGQTYYVNIDALDSYLAFDFSPEFADVLRFRNLDLSNDFLSYNPMTYSSDLVEIPDSPYPAAIMRYTSAYAPLRTHSVKFDIVNTSQNCVTLSKDGQTYSLLTDWLDLYQKNDSFLNEEDFLNQQSVYCMTWNGRPFIAISDEIIDVINYAYVLGVDDAENPQQVSFITRINDWIGYRISTFPIEQLAPYMTDTQIKVGDILKLRNMDFTIKNRVTYTFDFEPDIKETPADLPFEITITGTMFDYPTKEFTVYGKGMDGYVVVADDYGYTYNTYFAPNNFEKLPSPNRITMKVGDTVTCIIDENGQPIATYRKPEQTTITPTGDADGNGTVNILDVIEINRAVLGKSVIPADRIPYIDFNGDGVVDASDSLAVLKLLVSLD